MKVIINENCINCGHCYNDVDAAGVVFKDGDGLAAINEGADFAANIEMIKKAVDECPVAAIEIIEDEVAAPAGVPVEDASEPEIPVEAPAAAPEAAPAPMAEKDVTPEVGSSSAADDDLPVETEIVPAQENDVMSANDEIPLG